MKGFVFVEASRPAMKSRDVLLTLIPAQLETSLSKTGALYQAAHFCCVKNIYIHLQQIFILYTKHYSFLVSKTLKHTTNIVCILKHAPENGHWAPLCLSTCLCIYGTKFLIKKKWQIDIWHQYNFGLKCDKFGTLFFIKYL